MFGDCCIPSLMVSGHAQHSAEAMRPHMMCLAHDVHTLCMQGHALGSVCMPRGNAFENG